MNIFLISLNIFLGILNLWLGLKKPRTSVSNFNVCVGIFCLSGVGWLIFF